MANSNMTMNDILSGWVSAESYDAEKALMTSIMGSISELLGEKKAA